MRISNITYCWWFVVYAKQQDATRICHPSQQQKDATEMCMHIVSYATDDDDGVDLVGRCFCLHFTMARVREAQTRARLWIFRYTKIATPDDSDGGFPRIRIRIA